MHSQLFHPANNEDGYVSVICHRERYLKELLAMGWFETADEAIRASIAKVEPLCHPIYEGPPISDMPDFGLVGGATGFGLGPMHDQTVISGDHPVVDGLTKNQRKKLRLNK